MATVVPKRQLIERLSKEQIFFSKSMTQEVFHKKHISTFGIQWQGNSTAMQSLPQIPVQNLLIELAQHCQRT